MASSSGTYKEGGINKQGHNSVSSPYNGGSVHGEWGVPTFQHQQTISMDWTPDEQTLLEEGLAKYATESNIIRYAKIAVQLKNKTVRDVALRCRWMTKKEISKRRKEDFNARKSKDRKEKFIESSAKPSRLSIQSGPSQAPGMVSNCNDDNIPYNDINGATRQLLQQNAWAFKQISTNLSTHQLHENIGLLSQARDNIFQILTNMNDMGPTMKRMPPLPKMNEELASSILPPTTNFPIQL
ncbi:histone H2A deubiquitinase [Perilla frutescens var. hirtella]|uniref:Histone H2A deubiquitinase n=1 Tax=Perilla frutescens var. hirtella TaxID=608512 RepID=A0AAD4JGM9_PERFH|nr:histone H2A deubiquitinase [Perilla frutescens var. hirtella]KAH6816040.1 histone H2A deubiquitinase [Perilla frutescens var. frutescens]KAH6833422.1 histone H2A deubiquitinase [Perilla frutescens var. hirtella]